nr:MAG TPA: hypothetical protein [Caudoviricetes sp.]
MNGALRQHSVSLLTSIISPNLNSDFSGINSRS